MNKKMKVDNIDALLEEINYLYSKYSLLCTVDYYKIKDKNISDKDLYFSAMEIFKSLNNNYESIFHEIDCLCSLV